MRCDKHTFEHVQKAFNTISLLKGQYANIATCDEHGNPNVAPAGSIRIVDEHTVHVLQGFLPRTRSNLMANPRAAFSVCTRSNLFRDILSLRNNRKMVMGYRVYADYAGVDESKAAIEQEIAVIAGRVPFIARGFLLSFLRKNIQRVLIFQITGIREVV